MSKGQSGNDEDAVEEGCGNGHGFPSQVANGQGGSDQSAEDEGVQGDVEHGSLPKTPGAAGDPMGWGPWQDAG